MSAYPGPSIYDILHSPGSRAELDALTRIARRHGLAACERLACLEPACGTGRLLRLLERRGGLVHGFDQDPNMLAYARRRLTAAAGKRLFRAQLDAFAAQLRPSSIDFAYLTINSVRHLHSDSELLSHLADVATVLKPTGVYVVGISLSAYGREAPSEDIWHAARGRCRVDQIIQYLPPTDAARFEQVIAHWIVRRPRSEEHFDHSYRLRCYDEAEWDAVIAKSRLRVVGQYDDRGAPMPIALGAYRLYALSPLAGGR